MTAKKQKPKAVEVDGIESEVNEDGLPIGPSIDFATIQRVLAGKANGNTKEDDAS